MSTDISSIFTHGNLIDVNVGIWTAERQLQSEDLGLKDTDVSEAFNLGSKKLVPPEKVAEFRHLDYKIRNTLQRYSFAFAFGQARFVPKTVFADFVAEADAVIKEFDNLADAFEKAYPQYKLDMRKFYVEAANSAYDRARQLCGFSQDRDEFINAFLERVDKFYPPVEKIRQKFHMEYVVFQVALPDLTRASYEDIAEENEKVNLLQEAYRKSIYRKVHEFVDKIVSEQRTRVNEVTKHVAEALKTGRKISESTLNMVRKMIEEFRKMNVVEDRILDDKLLEFRTKYLDGVTAKKVRENAALQEEMLKELNALADLAGNQEAITAIADDYRSKINL